MTPMPLRWKLKEVLDENNLSAYRLFKHTGISPSTVYRLTANKTEGVQGRVLDDILTGLHELTGKRYDVGDLLTWEPEQSQS